MKAFLTILTLCLCIQGQDNPIVKVDETEFICPFYASDWFRGIGLTIEELDKTKKFIIDIGEDAFIELIDDYYKKRDIVNCSGDESLLGVKEFKSTIMDDYYILKKSDYLNIDLEELKSN